MRVVQTCSFHGNNQYDLEIGKTKEYDGRINKFRFTR